MLLRVDYAAREDLVTDYLSDLGEGGLFVRTELPLEVGFCFSVALSLPGLIDPVTVECVVRWRRAPGADDAAHEVGLGLEFLGRASDRERVQRLVRETQDTKRPPRARPRRGVFRVLLAENNAFVSELFRHALARFQDELVEYQGHELITARSGQDAVRLLESTRPDFVILDHFLPGMTGSELIRKIRSMPEHERTPILMVSVGGNEVRREAIEAGATLFMDKPVRLTQLLDTLRALIARDACH